MKSGSTGTKNPKARKSNATMTRIKTKAALRGDEEGRGAGVVFSAIDSSAAYTSRITGRISGRLEVCLLIYRFRSTRIFSLITHQSEFSSALDSETVFISTERAPGRQSA